MGSQPRTGTSPPRPVRSSTAAHLSCPFCYSYDISRMFLASLNLDSCECSTCGARWDEDRQSGEYRGRANPSSVFATRGTSRS